MDNANFKIGSSPTYKYMKLNYAKDMLQNGTIRIGTLYEYQDVSKHGSAIGDADEGKREIFFDIGPEGYASSPTDTSPRNAFVRKMFTGKGNIHISNLTIEQGRKSPDLYLYCSAARYSEDTMRTAFGCDACVRIDNPRAFFEAIEEHLIRNGLINESGYAAYCYYTKRRHHVDNLSHIAEWRLKDPSFAYQEEVRAAWTPNSSTPAPAIITCPGIIPHCSPHNFSL